MGLHLKKTEFDQIQILCTFCHDMLFCIIISNSSFSRNNAYSFKRGKNILIDT